MTHVPPGDETGYYCIILGGIPWQLSWQKLKDFTRNCAGDGTFIDVDHAEIYPNGKGGYVRIRGKSDFQKALKHLDGAHLQNMCLLADGRNETNPVVIPDTTNAKKPSLRRNYSHHTHAPSTVSEPPSKQSFQRHDSVSSIHPDYLCVRGYGDWSQYSCPPTDPSLIAFSPNLAQTPFSPMSTFSNASYFSPQPTMIPVCEPPSPGMILSGAVMPATLYTTYTYPLATPIQHEQQYAISYSLQPTQPAQPPPLPAIPTIQLEARKLILTHLPQSLTESIVKEIILSALKKTPSSFPTIKREQIEVELAHHSDGKPKSHAFVVFENHSMAKRIVEALDRFTWQGKSVGARFAKEGVETTYNTPTLSTTYPSSSSSASRSSHSSTSQNKTYIPERTRTYRSQRYSVEGAEKGMAHLEVSRDEGNRGSGLRGRVKWKGREGEKEREKENDRRREKSREEREMKAARGTPLVVDGTGRK